MLNDIEAMGAEGKIGENVASGKPWGEDVGSAMGSGAVVGGAMGLIHGAMHTPPVKAPTDPLKALDASDNGLDRSLDEFQAARDKYVGLPSSEAMTQDIAKSGSVDEAIAKMQAAAQGPSELLDSVTRARDNNDRRQAAGMADMIDRQTELAAQQKAATTPFDQQNSLEQAATHLGLNTDPQTGETAAGHADLSPMDQRTAQGRLKVLRDQYALEGKDASGLAVAPHPNVEGRFAIADRGSQMPDLDLPRPPGPTPETAQARIESAALAGTDSARAAQDQPRQQVVDQIKRNIEARRGVASPEEAQALAEAGAGKPYDRVDPNLSTNPRIEAGQVGQDQRLQQATGIIPGEGGNAPKSRTAFSKNEEPAQVAAEQQARSDSRMGELAKDRQVAQQASDAQAAAAAAPSLKADDVIAAFRAPEPTASQRVTIDQARSQYTPEDLKILQAAGKGPFALNGAERTRLRELKLSEAREEPKEASSMGTPLSQERSDQLRNAPKTDLSTLPDQSKAKPGELSKQHHRFLKMLASVFGKKLNVFDWHNEHGPDGFYDPLKPNEINLNRNAQMSHLVVFGHELLHALARDNPAAYEAIKSVMKIRADKEGEFQNTKGVAGNHEEAIADLHGNLFADTSFWHDVFEKVTEGKGDESARTLGGTIQKVIGKFLKALGGMREFTTGDMVEDLGKVREAMTSALADYAHQQRGEARERVLEERGAPKGDMDQQSPQNKTGPPDEFSERHEARQNALTDAVEGPLAERHAKRQAAFAEVTREGKQAAATAAARKEMGVLPSDQRENNGSGESAASMEALSRMSREKALDQPRYRIRRDGTTEKLIGPNAVDARVRPGSGEVIVQKGVGRDKWTRLDQDPAMGQSAVARAMAATARLSEKRAEIRPTETGFAAHDETGKRIGRLESNLTPEQSKKFDEKANVDMVKVDKEHQGKGVGADLYKAWHDAHEGRVAPSGKTSPDAWKVWKRDYPAKVDEFVKQEAERLRDGGNRSSILGNITDPDVRRQVLEEASGVMASEQRDEYPRIERFKDLGLRRATANVHDSAASAFADRPHKILPGVREVPLAEFKKQGGAFYDSPEQQERIRALAEQIKKNKAIEPVFVARHTDGSQVLSEGQHRARALESLGYDSVPARVMVDDSGTRASEKREGPNPISLEGIHYSKQPRTRLSSAFSGTSNPGAEAERGAMKRVNFYVDKGQGVKPESGVGAYAHRAELKNLYDAGTDAEYHKADSSDHNDFEQRVKDAGYSGYYAPDFRTDQGAVAMLGDHDIPVEHVGQGARPPSGVPVQRASRNDTGYRETISALQKQPGLPAGAVAADVWGDRIKRANPGLYDEMAKTGLFNKLADQKGALYKDELIQQYKDLAREGVSASEKRAMLNVGHAISEENGGGELTPEEIRSAIEQRGIKVHDMVTHQSGTEPTSVVSMDRSMSPGELHGLSMDLKQDAIAQRHPEGGGLLEGPKAKDWGGAYNPDYFMHPDGRTDTEHGAAMPIAASEKRDEMNPEIVATLGKHIRNLLPEERAKLRRDTAEKFVDIIQGLPSANEMAATAFAGRAKRGWYEHSARAISHVFGADGTRFAGLLAALSPQCSVETNLLNALKMWKNWNAEGRPTTRQEIVAIAGRSVQGNKGEKSVLDAWKNNAVRMLSSDAPEKVVLSGPKVNSFMRNLLGHVDEVTNDAWMSNYALVDQKIFAGKLNAAGTEPGKRPGYLAMSARVREAAKTLTRLTGEEWTPSEVQETIWSWAKTLYEMSSVDKSAVENIKDKSLTDELINSTPDFRSLFNDSTYSKILSDAGYGDRLAGLRSGVDLEGTRAEARRAEGQAAPFAADTQQRYELRAAERLDELRRTGKAARDDVSENEVAASDKRDDLFPGEFAGRRTTTPTERVIDSSGNTERGRNVDSVGNVISSTKQGLKNFWRWFGNSDVTDDKGAPLVLYHSTNSDVSRFETNRVSSNNYGLLGNVDTRRAGIFLTPDREFSQEYLREGSGQNVMPVYARLENPLDLRRGLSEQDERTLDEHGLNTRAVHNVRDTWDLFDSDDNGKNDFVDGLRRAGYDGAIIREDSPTGETKGGTTYVAFDPDQVKSALGNKGTFDRADADVTRSDKRDEVTESKQRIVDDSGRQYTPEQKAAFAKIGRTVEEPTLKEKVQSLRQNIGKKITQGLVDQFLPIKDITKDGYLLARLSKGAPGALDAFLNHGKLSLKDGVYDADRTGGAIERVFAPLKNESGDFLWWVAGNRAALLAREDRENLFGTADIQAVKDLHKGTTDFDYTLRNGQVTRDRTLIYRDALQEFNEFHKNALDMAEQSGLIDPESRKIWEKEFYVPFNRVSDAGQGFVGNSVKSGLVRQQAIKMLKGGRDKLNSDLLQNTLMNWNHLIDSAAKNRAAKATLEAADKMGIAVPSDAHTIASMGAAGLGKAVWYMDRGEKQHYLVDPDRADVLAAINSLQDTGFKNPVMNALSTMKHWLTVGATSSPAFKIRHLIRGSMVAMGISPTNLNPIANAIQGFKATDKSSQTYVSTLAGGGIFHFGSMLEGNTSENVKKLIARGIATEGSILNSPDKVKAVLGKMQNAFDAYNEFSNRGEEMPRAALYEQLRAKGFSHAEASLAARDMLDYSLQGAWPMIRAITQTVPFMNARAQGLYKLGRAGVENPARMAAVLGVMGLASVGLMAHYQDDPDWKNREDSDRDNFWWFKFGGTAYRIPKPFEMGAIATLAERGIERFTSDEMTNSRLLRVVGSTIFNQLNMNPIPQAVKPIMDVYANKDAFTGKPIETAGMEKLQPEYRYTANTSMAARAASTALNAPLQATGLAAAGLNAPSPVQIDHLVQGYFGWLGSFAVAGADMATRPLTNEPTRPTADYVKMATGGIASELPEQGSRYVTQMYNQAQALEQAYGTWQSLIKAGRGDEARQFYQDNRKELGEYGGVEGMKQNEAKINEMIRMIERSQMDPDVKRERITALKQQANRNASRLAPA